MTHKTYQLNHVLDIKECQDLATALINSCKLTKEQDNEYYYNSMGVYNLPESLDYLPRLEPLIKNFYGENLKFSNSYTRIYQKNSFLGIHTDRPGLDITITLCLRKDSTTPWPLCISNKPWLSLWDSNRDHSKWLEDYEEFELTEGMALACEGVIYPHWRNVLMCEEYQKNIYAFYHWTKVTVPGGKEDWSFQPF